MERYGLARRDWSAATYAYRNPDGDPFDIRMPATAEEWKLFGVGIGLYMGEGSKKGFSVEFANADPRLHRTFITFLETFCGVERQRLKAWLNIFDDCDVQQAMLWWYQELGLSLEQFHKTHVRKSRSGSYTKRSTYGTLKISFSNTRLLKIIQDWCDEVQETGPMPT
jgi:hypothetical protein